MRDGHSQTSVSSETRRVLSTLDESEYWTSTNGEPLLTPLTFVPKNGRVKGTLFYEICPEH